MKKLQLNKLKLQDLEVLNEALELYGAYLFFFIQSEPNQALYIYKSICVELQFMIANKLKVRSLPANTLLNLEQHQAFVFQNALQHLISRSEHDLTRAVARRLLERVNKMLPVVAQTQE